MDADAQAGLASRVGGRRDRPRPTDHEARTRDDTFLVTSRDAIVDARTLPEVVSVDDQATGQAFERLRLRRVSDAAGRTFVRRRQASRKHAVAEAPIPWTTRAS